MHFSTLAVAATLGLIQAAYAHTHLNQIWINDSSPGLGTCIRTRKDRTQATSPVGPGSSDLACGVDGQTPVAITCPAKAGDKLTFGFNMGKAMDPVDKHLASSHKGPCSIMAKKVDSATKSTGSGDGWFRIFYEGYDKASGKWCTERMMANGMLSITIPGDLAPGDYLFRSELLALHSAVHGDPQFYVGCAQIFLASGGSARPGNTVSLPSDSYAKPGSPAMNFNYYYPANAAESYPNYGPPSYKPTGAGGGQTLTQTDGLPPKDCVLQVENWCGPEVPSYSDGNSCWNSHRKCYEIAETCWKGVLMDNSKCEQYKKKCEGIKQSCESGGSRGPPNAGKVLTPAPEKGSCPAPLNDAGAITSYTNNDVAGSGFDVKGKQAASPDADTSASAYAAAASSSPSTAVSPENTSSPSAAATATSASGYGGDSPSSSPSTAVSPENTSAAAASSSPSPPSYASSSSSAVAPVPAPTGCPSAVTVTKTVTETVAATAVAPSGQPDKPDQPDQPAASPTPSPSPSTTNTVDAEGATSSSASATPTDSSTTITTTTYAPHASDYQPRNEAEPSTTTTATPRIRDYRLRRRYL